MARIPEDKLSDDRVLKEHHRAYRYLVVGGVGFAVDAGVLSALVHWGGWDPYTARVVSFLAAVTVTWLLHRSYSFVGLGRFSVRSEYVRFLGTQVVGAASNFLVYSALIFMVPWFGTYPVIPLAFGSAVGLLVNFVLSRLFVFPGKA
ncbi:MAG: GtrA family protein [Hyphomicrobiales bacterium]|nr:GtrA family protein [Hyphomicrobiales bacterium]MCP5373052.1 GtrA family protein [Hyphomicrobiales bacterium]